MAGATATRSLLVVALLLTATCAPAVEVTVKTPTKLYDAKGKVLAEVEAARTFKAETLRGKWVWGFLPLKGGGARGWIPLAALELDEETRRKLETAEPAQPGKPKQPTRPRDDKRTSDRVLLRYKLKPGEVQVYEVVYAININISGAAPGGDDDTAAAMPCRATYSIHGKRRQADGTMLAEIRFHEFLFQFGLGGAIVEVDGREIGAAVRQNAILRAEERGIAVYVNRKRIPAHKWISPQNSLAADAAELKAVAIEARLNERGEILELKPNDAVDEITGLHLDSLFSGQFAYPKDPVHPGDSWTASWAFAASGLVEEGAKTPNADKTRYTVVERTTFRNRRCLKLRLNAAAGGTRMRRAARGVSYIDEATGIQLCATMAATEEDITGDTRQRTKVSVQIAVRYKGNKLPD